MANHPMIRVAAILWIALTAGVAFTATADDFYSGKTIQLVVGTSAGSGFDTYSRLIGRHFSKHVPGHPSIVIQNMPGAGGLLAANSLYNVAKPDGLTMGIFVGAMVLQHALGNDAAKFDGRRFGWLGAPVTDSGICALTKASGVKSVEDWFASKRPIKIGATAPGSVTADVPKLLRVAIGLPIQVVEGYKGTAEVRLAADGGEIDGGCWGWESIKATWSKRIESGEVQAVLQTMLKAHPDLKDLPLAVNFAKTDEAREILRMVNGAYGVTVFPYTVPPGTPKDRLLILQKAFMETVRDPELLADAKNANLEIRPVDGPTLASTFASLYELQPRTAAKVREIILPK
jgi:tripartite-type tricarboxylate transporter receptor subunit TctC